ncbi:hypothetical protein T484DRAFT_1889384, partial [Baffinella frigidus]
RDTLSATSEADRAAPKRSSSSSSLARPSSFSSPSRDGEGTGEKACWPRKDELKVAPQEERYFRRHYHQAERGGAPAQVSPQEEGGRGTQGRRPGFRQSSLELERSCRTSRPEGVPHRPVLQPILAKGVPHHPGRESICRASETQEAQGGRGREVRGAENELNG